MKKRKIALIFSVVVCLVLAVSVMVIAFNRPAHKHDLKNAKTYHLTNDGIYYTMTCKDGCKVGFETGMSFTETLTAMSASDKIVLEEDIVINNEIEINSVVTKDELPLPIELNINLDLNNHTITTNVDETINDSLFMLNATYGKITFNIKNGKIESNDLSYIFRFATANDAQDTIILNTNNVEYKVVGNKATPLFAHNECSGIKVNAINSKFIAHKANDLNSDHGVGVYINSESVFNFTNCYVEGADAIYVKQGTVDLIGCELVNVELARRYAGTSENSFKAVGSCLATESYTTSQGTTKFNITITDCSMIGNYSSTMICLVETGEMGVQLAINSNSSINVESCRFNHNPEIGGTHDILHYPNDELPQYEGDGFWVA